MRLIYSGVAVGVLLAALAAIAQDNPTRDREEHETREATADRAEGVKARWLRGLLQESDSRFTGTAVEGSPFSADAVVETEQRLDDGNRIRRERLTKVSRDNDGRTREEFFGQQEQGYAQKPKLILIGDPQAHSYTVAYTSDRGDPVYEELSGIWEAGQRSEQESYEDFANADNVKRESLGRRTIEGVEAVGSRLRQVVPAGQIGNEMEIYVVLERWYSPELQAEVLVSRSDPRRGTTTYRLVNIQRTEPLALMFGPPAGYQLKADDNER